MKKRSKTIILVSILFSLFLLMGYSINKTGKINYLFKGFNSLKTIVFFAIFFIIFYKLLVWLYEFFDKKEKKSKNSKIYEFIFEKRPILIPFLIFLIAGLPILIIYYPGPVHWDGLKQIGYFYNIFPWSNHHPVFPTILMGISMKIGRFLINDNFGVFLFTFPQYIFSAFTFSYMLSFLRELKAPKYLIVTTFIFFLICPIWYINAYTLVKDTYYYLIFIFFFIFYIKLYYDQSKKNKIWLIIFSLLLMLFRNNGIYVVLLSFIVAAIFNKDVRNVLLKYCLIVILFQTCYNITIGLCGISQGNNREMLSVPIQQTARYVTKYELTTDEKEFIESVFHMDVGTIQRKYDAELSDPIKFSFNAKGSTLKEYFVLWFKMFLKHPKVYVDAFLENYYGYFYPPKKEYKDGLAQFEMVYNTKVNTGYFDFYYIKSLKPARAFIKGAINEIRDLKVIDLLFNVGTYTWVLIILMGYALYKKRYDKLVLSMPLIITLAFCFVSPVNAYVRYMYPIIVGWPIYMALVFKKGKIK